MSAAPIDEQPGLVEGVDFPTLALAQVSWEDGALQLRLHPQNAQVEGTCTQFRICGLQDPTRWRVDGDAQATVSGPNIVIDTTVRDHRLALLPA
jgi:hypothetical protein